MSVLPDFQASNPRLRFCSLKYNPGFLVSAAPLTSPVILLVLLDEENVVYLLANPNLSGLITGRDREYIFSMIADILERAKLEPNDLFRQLCALEVGPLVTHQIGQNLSEQTNLRMESENFVLISSPLITT